jgi:orotate phosphoribosyltransferase
MTFEKVTSQASAATEQLRALLAGQAILNAGPGQPITGRDGSTAPWMLYTPQISLGGDGLHLAAACLLERLTSFETTQLAAYGYTAIPLMMGCIALGAGRYSGLMIREQRKAHGANRQIDGPADRSRPVVVVDDSLSSGRSLRTAIHILESHGFEVEGTVSLVHFPYRGGAEWARALGYRVETIFDVWADLDMPIPTYVPGHTRVRPQWSDQRIPPGLRPAEVARLVAHELLTTGRTPLPPIAFDRDYDGSGGVYVSFRDIRTDWRYARDGFWHFNPADADPTRDVVLATVRTLQRWPTAVTLDRLPTQKLAVSFLSALRPAAPSELDFDRLGIIVRSRYWPTKLGGALPNTQVFTSELEQLSHARRVNAQIGEREPYDLFVHEIHKDVEPGHSWPPYGQQEQDTGWRTDPAVGTRLLTRAWEILTEASGSPLPDDLIPTPDAIGVTLYDHGAIGCGVAWRKDSLDATVAAAARYAARDTRFVPDPLERVRASGELVVTLLHDREWLGDMSVERVARKMRLGLDGLSVHQGAEHSGVYLDSVLPHSNWSTETAARELLKKAGIESGPKTWFTYRASSWLRTPDEAVPLEYGFARAARPTTDDGWQRETLALLADRIRADQDATGLPVYCRRPLAGTEVRRGTAGRLCHALVALAAAGGELDRPDLGEAAAIGIDYCLRHVQADGRFVLPGHRSSPMGWFALIEAITACAARVDTEATRRLALALRTLFHRDGRIADDAAERVRQRQDHDFLPGVALLSFAEAAKATRDPVYDLDWDAHFAFYARRWEMAPGWGLTAWQLQAWSAIHRLTGRPEYAEHVFRMADWAVERQLAKNGVFLTALSPESPSFHVGFIAEGIADAWRLAAELMQTARAARYAASWHAAMQFMDRLVFRARDAYCVPDPARAIGGVRGTLASSECRVDYASHLVLALVKGRAATRAG